jgi:3-dehydroquinate dehydratase-1
MDVKYCLPILAKTEEEARTVWKKNLSIYHHFEFWLDYMDDLQDSFVEEICTNLGERAIFLFRRLNLEKPRITQSRRQSLIDIIAGSLCFLDMDLTTQSSDLEFRCRCHPQLKTITSYHNYRETPCSEELESIVSNIKRYQPTICKVATLCNSHSDALRLMQLTLTLRQGGDRFLVMGMGQYGKISRICGTIWGNEMAFAPLTKEGASAPGQLTLAEFKAVIDILGGS